MPPQFELSGSHEVYAFWFSLYCHSSRIGLVRHLLGGLAGFARHFEEFDQAFFGLFHETILGFEPLHRR
jgi:hypothetical protein